MKNRKQKTNMQSPEHITEWQRWNGDNKLITKSFIDLRDPDTRVVVIFITCTLLLLVMLYVWAFLS